MSGARFMLMVKVRGLQRRQAAAPEPEVPRSAPASTAAQWFDDGQRVTDALIMAIWRRGKLNGLLHHSDQGSYYPIEPFQRLMADHGICRLMSRSSNVWDNAA
jgi:hypothetical protein